MTAEAEWLYSDALLSAGAPGLVTVDPRIRWGGARVEARYENKRDVKDLTVVPTAGTFRLMGPVVEAGFPSVPVADARVEVTTGVGAGLFATTDFYGTYTLFGVAGETTIRVTKDNYQPAEQNVTIASHRTLTTSLQSLVPPADVSGTYTLTIAAAEECGVVSGAGHLPEDVRVRKYSAVVTQTGPALRVVATGMNIAIQGRDYFVGRVGPEGIVFDLTWDPWWDYPTLVEQLTITGTVFAPTGIAVLKGSGDRFGGTLDGGLHVFDTVHLLAPITAIAECYSATHQFVLSR
ncbi:MAG TPA: carboxypeptidase-like regulatory domain-containing protein [Vicinamibacterales bacterium]|nr:carboxypeptidase-like regulatory domain-containing protein [Vicinamibacterales bacterium]